MAKIMVVDDDLQFCGMMMDVLRAVGHEACFATDPGHLYTQLNGFAPDLVVLDMQMPGGGAPMAKKVLEKNPALLGLKILFHSSMPVDKMKHWFPEAPNHRYALKGMPVLELRKLVEEFLAA
ncbi:MAG: response regulator [Elusimicrobia bacterium]|nr:response regulator [Elusimicrobiota bacterium]